MDKRTLAAFSDELSKEAFLGAAIGAVSRLAPALGRIGRGIGSFARKMAPAAKKNFPTFSDPQNYKNWGKSMTGGVTGAAATLGTGAVGVGSYGVYKGVTAPPQPNMSGY